jgi:hypothetical protein
MTPSRTMTLSMAIILRMTAIPFVFQIGADPVSTRCTVEHDRGLRGARHAGALE